MVIDGASYPIVSITGDGTAANSVCGLGGWLWISVIGALVVVWLFIGLKNMSKIKLEKKTILLK